MLARTEWIDSVGRYEKLFRDWPPPLYAPFVERVRMVKARWDPLDGRELRVVHLALGAGHLDARVNGRDGVVCEQILVRLSAEQREVPDVLVRMGKARQELVH
jgi:hypothetical protein